MRENYEVTRYFEDLFQSVNQASMLLLDTNFDTFEQRLFEAMGIVAKTVDVDRMYIWKNFLIDGKLQCTQIYEWSEDAEPQQGNEYTVNVTYDDVMQGLEKILSNDQCINSIVREMAPAHQEHLVPQGILSILIVPVFINNRFWGFVGFDDCHRERIFTDNEDRILRSSALLFAHAYHHNEANRLIHEQNEFQQVIFNEAPIGLIIFDKEMNVVECNPILAQMFGVPPKEIAQNFFDLLPEYQANGMKSKDRLYELLKQTLSGETPKTDWTHLLPDGKLLSFEVTFRCINQGGNPIVLAFAYDLSKIKKLETEVTSLKDKVYECPLTSIYNRRFFDERANQIIKSSQTNGQFSLLLLDIDYFKKYNDNYGHQMGDECLKTVAQILSKSIGRTGDFVARYGGEEFVIVLPYTDGEGACLIAEKIIRNMHKADILHEYSDNTNYVTLSIGVTSGIMDSSLTIDDFVKVADDMLYSSKAAGRNKYTFSVAV
ncbi:MAG: diguanylate cyclase [Bacteroidales bacterium]|jgi:diguanylate cyclase (GGDEF)-like protein/PAS domain S-box-containing protein|nr:diguanylate cyclase [Bacteroidales bacterium]